MKPWFILFIVIALPLTCLAIGVAVGDMGYGMIFAIAWCVWPSVGYWFFVGFDPEFPEPPWFEAATALGYSFHVTILVLAYRSNRLATLRRLLAILVLALLANAFGFIYLAIRIWNNLD